MRPPKVRVYASIQERPERNQPYIVRWNFDGREMGEPFAFRGQAKRFHARLTIAAEDEARWNRTTGLPSAWDKASPQDVATFCRDYVAGEWDTLAPNSRRSLVTDLVSFVLAATRRGPTLDTTHRSQIRHWLSGDELPANIETWVERYSLQLAELDKEALDEIDRRLRIGVNGAPLGPISATRAVKTARRALDVAVRRGLMSDNPWPKRDKGRASRKSAKKVSTKRSVMTAAQARLVLQALPTHQPASHAYQAMSAVGFFSGLRPSEVVVLELSDLELPETDWGVIHVTKAWNGVGPEWGDEDEDVGPTKTVHERDLPATPELVGYLRAWVARSGITEGPLFRTRNGQRPTQSNWNRALARACETSGVERISAYDLRHFCASHYLNAGLDIVSVAKLLGHSPETLLRIYAHEVRDDEAAIRERLGRAFG